MIFCIGTTICFTNLALTSKPRDWSPEEEVKIAYKYIIRSNLLITMFLWLL